MSSAFLYLIQTVSRIRQLATRLSYVARGAAEEEEDEEERRKADRLLLPSGQITVTSMLALTVVVVVVAGSVAMVVIAVAGFAAKVHRGQRQQEGRSRACPRNGMTVSRRVRNLDPLEAVHPTSSEERTVRSRQIRSLDLLKPAVLAPLTGEAPRPRIRRECRVPHRQLHLPLRTRRVAVIVVIVVVVRKHVRTI